jgi:hypothetical protein
VYLIKPVVLFYKDSFLAKDLQNIILRGLEKAGIKIK